jgi:hypothetical protein
MCTALEIFPPLLQKTSPPDEPLSVDTHEILSHVSTALSDTSAYHVLLGDFNIHHSIWGGGWGKD